jgi:SSS family solute:Na+ symporter
VANLYGVVFTAIASIYVVLGGMFSIVWADVLKFTVMAIASVAVAIIAMTHVDTATLAALTPAGWHTPFFGWTLDLNWTANLAGFNQKVSSDGYTVFGALIMMMLFKGVLASAAGPAPNYDMQKILSTRSPREAAMMSGFVSVVLQPVRYLMIAGFATLAIVHFQDLGVGTANAGDYDRILPAAIHRFAPPGVLGLIVAGLLAAFMSTFAATLNAAPAYLVNDVYRRRINPDASRRRLIGLSYVVSAAVVVISAVIGLYVPSINSLLIWIVSGLWGGYTAANVLKWYWWRLNGYGFFAGMLLGIIGALALPPLLAPSFPRVATDVFPLYSFPLLLLLSAVGCVAVTLLTPADEMTLLKDFYRRVRPWGYWGPVREAVLQEDPSFPVNRNFRRDAFNIVVGTVVQTALVALPIYVVVRRFDGIATCLALIAVGGLVLKKSWFDRLADA